MTQDGEHSSGRFEASLRIDRLCTYAYIHTYIHTYRRLEKERGMEEREAESMYSVPAAPTHVPPRMHSVNAERPFMDGHRYMHVFVCVSLCVNAHAEYAQCASVHGRTHVCVCVCV
jgi:hypothetical protein